MYDKLSFYRHLPLEVQKETFPRVERFNGDDNQVEKAINKLNKKIDKLSQLEKSKDKNKSIKYEAIKDEL